MKLDKNDKKIFRSVKNEQKREKRTTPNKNIFFYKKTGKLNKNVF
jgi:hypothetical protein